MAFLKNLILTLNEIIHNNKLIHEFKLTLQAGCRWIMAIQTRFFYQEFLRSKMWLLVIFVELKFER